MHSATLPLGHPGHSVAPAPDHPEGAAAPCARWSEHAALLAQDVACRLERFEDNPATATMVDAGLLQRIRPGVQLALADRLSMPERAVALGCALAGELRPGDVIARLSAVWVLLAGRLPVPLTFTTQARPRSLAGVRLHQADLPARDLELIGGCPVTTPTRTATDLLRHASPPEALVGVGRLLASGHVDEEQISASLSELRAQPQVRRAQDLWDGILTGRRCEPRR
ncbi:MAG: hypothetical protein Q4G40_00640 [Brachybacterium sp.]|nr:hypothetical protein [Brachybacterium sp.]